MADVITDSELREELVAFGVDVGPITNDTRSLWLKKLDKLNAEKRKKRRSTPVPNGDGPGLGGFSSDPDDDYEVFKGGTKSRASTNNNNNNNNRRQSGRHDPAVISNTNAAFKGNFVKGAGDRNGVKGKSATPTNTTASTTISDNDGKGVSSKTASSTTTTVADAPNTVIPGAANIKKRFTDSTAPGGAGTKSGSSDSEKLVKRYIRQLEDGEISDTDSENDRKLANGKKKATTTTLSRKSVASSGTTSLKVTSTGKTAATTATKQPIRAQTSETEVKSLLKSIQNPTDDVGSSKNGNLDQPTAPSLTSYTRAFPRITPSLSSKPSSSLDVFSKPTATLISGRPAISRQRPSASSSDFSVGAPSSADVVGSFNGGTIATTSTVATQNLILNDTIISDPHNSLPSECRPRLSMGSIGPRSSTPYSGHLSQKIDPLGKHKVLGVNGLAPRETSDATSTVRSAAPPPTKFKTTDEEILSKEFKTSSEGFMSTYSHYISVVIVVMAAGFFLALAFAYLNLFSYDFPTEKLQLGDATSKTHRLVGVALEELRKVAIRHNCRETSLPSLSNDKLKTLLKTTDKEELGDVFAHLRKWRPVADADADANFKLTFIDESGKETQSNDDIHSIHVESDYIPIKCRVSQFITDFVTLAVTVSVSILTTWMLFSFFRNKKRKREEKQKKLFFMVDSILEFLTKQSQARYLETGESSPVFAISHVRDALIAPVDRVALSPCWVDACQFIAKNESRVREETQLIKGEEYIVWRWVADPRAPVSTPASPTAPSSLKPDDAEIPKSTTIPASLVSQAVPADYDVVAPTSATSSLPASSASVSATLASMSPGSSTSNQWQGQAFQNIRLNAPPYSLTQCLKIRNMFDPDVQHDPALQLRVQDAILDKCGPTANVQHVAINVDKVSREGCVYVKCRDADSAGVAYRALHGWWYDGKLVSVKYLPLKRYHERFPDTAYASTLLQPSSFKL